MDTKEPSSFAILVKNAVWVILLTFLLSCQSLLITYSKRGSDYMYSTASTIFMAEVTKFFISSFILMYQGEKLGFSINKDTILYAVPALIYFVQNNLVFWALRYVDPTTYQVLVNLKILTTGVLFRFALGKELSSLQWSALVLLAVGCATSQLSTDCKQESVFAVPLPGLLICIALAVLSASAGIATEWLMKKSALKSSPLHRQNIHLYFFGIIFCGIGYLGERGPEDGLFDGYNFVTVLVVMSYSFTGLIVSVIMKYADNMVKIYAVAVSMALTMVLSIFLFDFEPSSQLFFGIITITISILMYFNIVTGEIPSKSSPTDNTPPRTLQKNKSSASLDDIKVEQQEAETKNN